MLLFYKVKKLSKDIIFCLIFKDKTSTIFLIFNRFLLAYLLFPLFLNNLLLCFDKR